MKAAHLAFLVVWLCSANSWCGDSMTIVPEDYRKFFEIDLPTGLTVKPESPVEDFILYRFMDKEETILTAYVGNAPDQHGFGSGATLFRTDAVQIASHWDSGALIRREWLIRLCSGQWPKYLHFFTGKDAVKGDRLASSIHVKASSECRLSDPRLYK